MLNHLIFKRHSKLSSIVFLSSCKNSNRNDIKYRKCVFMRISTNKRVFVSLMCAVMECFMSSWEAVWMWEWLWVLRAHAAPALRQHFAYTIFLFIWLLFWFLMKSHTNRPKCWQHKLQGQKANPPRAPFR